MLYKPLLFEPIYASKCVRTAVSLPFPPLMLVFYSYNEWLTRNNNNQTECSPLTNQDQASVWDIGIHGVIKRAGNCSKRQVKQTD